MKFDKDMELTITLLLEKPGSFYRHMGGDTNTKHMVRSPLEEIQVENDNK
jgi:hypothetical protein